MLGFKAWVAVASSLHHQKRDATHRKQSWLNVPCPQAIIMKSPENPESLLRPYYYKPTKTLPNLKPQKTKIRKPSQP